MALRVFPDLTEEELEILSIVDAFVNLMDDLLDEKNRRKYGVDIRALAVRMTAVVFSYGDNDIVHSYITEHLGCKVFDEEYRFRTYSDKLKDKSSRDELLHILEQLYLSEAHDRRMLSRTFRKPWNCIWKRSRMRWKGWNSLVEGLWVY